MMWKFPATAAALLFTTGLPAIAEPSISIEDAYEFNDYGPDWCPDPSDRKVVIVTDVPGEVAREYFCSGSAQPAAELLTASDGIHYLAVRERVGHGNCSPNETLTIYRLTRTLSRMMEMPITWWVPDPAVNGTNCTDAGYAVDFSTPGSGGLLLKLQFNGPNVGPDRSFSVLIDKVEP